MPQPNLVPVSFKCSRNTQSKGVSGATSTLGESPLTDNLMELMGILQEILNETLARHDRASLRLTLLACGNS
jgi:hypothetical protein